MKNLIQNQSTRLNKKLNKQLINNKVFCIGLHKAGTTSLADFSHKFEFSVTHSISWIHNNDTFNRFNFFSDGRHFDNMNEFDFKCLYDSYPNAKFILQTRDPKS
ncbi:MAG: hypothetical protein ACJA0X_003318 [Cyclobacteriaceae bacterium]|jgi:hypothetical protein